MSKGAGRLFMSGGILMLTGLFLLPLGLAVIGLIPVTASIFAADFWEFIGEPSVRQSLGISLVLGVLPPLLAGYTAFWFLSRRSQLPTWIAPLLAMPHVAFAVGMGLLLLPGGLASRMLPGSWEFFQSLFVDKSLSFLVVVLWLKELPFVLLMTAVALHSAPLKQWRLVARTFGYRDIDYFWRLVFPYLLKKLRLPLCVVAIYGVSVVDVASVVGPNTPGPLAVRVLGWSQEFTDLSQQRALWGTALLFIMGLVTLAFVWLHERCACLWASRQLSQGVPVSRRVVHLYQEFGRIMGTAGVYLSILLTGAAFFTLILWSVIESWPVHTMIPQAWTWSHWQWEWEEVVNALMQTGFLALGVASGALIFVVVALELEAKTQRQLPDILMLLPLIIPQLALVFIWQQVVGVHSLTAPFLWVFWAQLIFAISYVWLTLAATYRRFSRIWLLQAKVLGYSDMQAWVKIKLRMLLAPLILAWTVAFSVSVLLYLPTVILGAGRVITITVEATAYGSGFDRSLAALYAFAQVVLPLVVFIGGAWLARRFRVEDPATGRAEA
ncbi:hypothetical protein [Aliidiomarina sanyensis]|uniref:ABC transmembrane type-1 domain-containing protein n=1 Tax=Aliidiomarina sanyensis TaxID=1249555 RepID=A0A432WN51_9GAMM|nr:hypothetical protein [Aliidiomarina sanyensis]RUO35230.1 hypothetical protein CWE11_04125 [Aliidiomarina sanyensis]